mmetsp:Transcript_548/g.833  ORF Transcript_548/g.833 Transcript_548/m.833 type:complete len:398 (-) Transcript_548:876-2069(-)
MVFLSGNTSASPCSAQAGLMVQSRSAAVAVVVEVFEVGVHDVFVDTALFFFRGVATFSSFCLLGFCLVDRLTQTHGRFGHVLDAAFDLGGIFGFQRFLQSVESQFDGFDRGRIDLVAMLFQRFLGGMHKALGLVAGFHKFLAVLVRFRVLLGFAHHLFDVVVGQTARRLDRDLLLFPGAFVLGAHGHDAVGVDVEGHFDLGHTARRGWDVLEVELTEHLVVGSHLALTLEHADRHGVLVVVRRREDLRLLGRDRRVAVDQTGEDAPERFDTERQRRHVEKDNILHVTLQNTGLNGGTHGNNLVRVHTLMGLFAEEVRHFLDNLGHTGHAADEDDLVDVTLGEAGVLEGSGAGLHRSLDQIADEAFQLRTSQLHDHMQRLAVGAHRDERLVDFGLRRA